MEDVMAIIEDTYIYRAQSSVKFISVLEFKLHDIELNKIVLILSSVLYFLRTRIFSDSCLFEFEEFQTRRKSIERYHILFQQTSRTYGGILVLRNIGSEEKPGIAGCREEVMDLSLTAEEVEQMEEVICYKKRGLYTGMNAK